MTHRAEQKSYCVAFNRTILELKYIKSYQLQILFGPFNRTILELK